MSTSWIIFNDPPSKEEILFPDTSATRWTTTVLPTHKAEELNLELGGVIESEEDEGDEMEYSSWRHEQDEITGSDITETSFARQSNLSSDSSPALMTDANCTQDRPVPFFPLLNILRIEISPCTITRPSSMKLQPAPLSPVPRLLLHRIIHGKPRLSPYSPLFLRLFLLTKSTIDPRALRRSTYS